MDTKLECEARLCALALCLFYESVFAEQFDGLYPSSTVL
jgi:hypothetical protein